MKNHVEVEVGDLNNLDTDFTSKGRANFPMLSFLTKLFGGSSGHNRHESHHQHHGHDIVKRSVPILGDLLDLDLLRSKRDVMRDVSDILLTLRCSTSNGTTFR